MESWEHDSIDIGILKISFLSLTVLKLGSRTVKESYNINVNTKYSLLILIFLCVYKLELDQSVLMTLRKQ